MTATPAPFPLDIGIGGINVRLETRSPDFAQMMAARFRGFTTPTGAPHYVFDTEVVPLGTPDPVLDGVTTEVGVHREDGAWRLTCGDFEARFDPRAGRGQVRLHPSPYSLDTVLRILHTVLLAEEGGMLMHASSAVLDGRAWLFTGVSGSGKTTISRLAPRDARVLTDEMSFLRRDLAGGYRAHGTPFAGELSTPGENTSAPLAGIFLLAKGEQNRIDPLPPAQAVRTLLANVLYFARDDALTARVFDNAIALAAAVPVRRLTFYPDHRVWDLLRASA